MSMKFFFTGFGSGKTTLVDVYKNKRFPDGEVKLKRNSFYDRSITSTVKVDGKMVNVVIAAPPFYVPGGREVRRSGKAQEIRELQRIEKQPQYRTDVFIFTFSTVDPQTAKDLLETVLPEVKRFCPSAPILLLGTKTDLREDKDVLEHLMTKGMTPVSFEQGLQLANKIGAFAYREASAFTQQGVDEVFSTAFQYVKEHPSKERFEQEEIAREKKLKELGSTYTPLYKGFLLDFTIEDKLESIKKLEGPIANYPDDGQGFGKTSAESMESMIRRFVTTKEEYDFMLEKKIKDLLSHDPNAFSLDRSDLDLKAM